MMRALLCLFACALVPAAAWGDSGFDAATGDPLSGAVDLHRLPEPSGPHAIGTMVVDWTDATREETWTEDPHDRRRLVVQFWYPSERLPLRVPAPYVLRFPQMRPSLDRYFNDAPPAVTTHAALDAPPLEDGEHSPVVLLSHGMNSSRTFYTALAEELASHGFIVAAIDHPHWGPGVAFANGGTVDFESGLAGRGWLSPDQSDELVQEGVATMAEDQAFVARRLPAMADDGRHSVRRLSRRMDLDRVGVMGHSMGGMAAIRSAFTYAMFRAGATLDGYAWARRGMAPHGSPASASAKPVLVLMTGATVRGDSVAFARRHLDAFRQPTVVRMRDAQASSPSDMSLFAPGARGMAAAVTHRRMCDVVRVFFNEHLDDRGSFDATLRGFAGVERVDLPGMLESASRTAGGETRGAER